MKRGAGTSCPDYKTLLRKQTRGQVGGLHIPLPSATDWGVGISGTEAKLHGRKTATELRIDFIQHSLSHAAALASNGSNSNDLRQALDICRKCKEYYHWHKDSLPMDACELIAEQLAEIAEQLARWMPEFCAESPFAEGGI